MNPAPSDAEGSSELKPLLDCRTVMTQLWDYLDEELPQDRLDDIKLHLATCVGCSSHVAFCRSFLSQIKTAPVPADDVVALRARIQIALRQSA